MVRLWRATSWLIPIVALALAVPFIAPAAARSRAQAPTTPPLPGLEPSDAYGAGGERLTSHDSAGNPISVTEYDKDHHVREETTYTYYPGTKQKRSKLRRYFTPTGVVETEVTEHWGPDGRETDYSSVHYSAEGHTTGGERKQFGDPKTGSSTTRQRWNPQTERFEDVPPPTVSAAPPPATPSSSLAAVTDQLGVIVPRDYLPGDTITGSILPANIANAYATVPGFSVKDFSIRLPGDYSTYTDYNGLEIGPKNYGYTPVEDGHFTLHLPMNLNGALDLQLRQQDPFAGSPVTYTEVTMDPPVAAPAMPQNLVPSRLRYLLARSKTAHLIDLWNEAYDLELEWTDADDAGASDAVMDEIDDDLHDVYSEIDYVTAQLPAEVVTKLAHEMADETRAINEEFRNANPNGLTDEQTAELIEYDHWANFLDNEAEERMGFGTVSLLQSTSPYWTLPVLSQGRLGALRGQFSGDYDSTNIHLDGLGISTMAETPRCNYFMPPDGLAAGLHNFQIGDIGKPQTILPVFYMTLTMWADATQLRKGQSTTYHLKLTGLNGLPNSAWGSSFFPSDLVSPSELQGGSEDASRSGTITLSITNGSPGVISMQNVFTVLNAQSFAPSGTYQVDGGVGAILDGGFNIYGVARAYLQPDWAWGNTLGNTMALPADQSSGQTSGSSGTTSTASTPGLPSCDYDAGAATSDPLPSIDLSKICMGSDATRTFDQAIKSAAGSDSAYVDNVPVTPPTREETQKRIIDGEQAVKDWKKRSDDEAKKLSDVWMDAYSKVPQSYRDALSKAANDDYKAIMDERSARDSYWTKPTDESKAKFLDALSVSAGTHAAYETAGNALRDQFTPAQRAAVEAAEKEWKNAENRRAQAEAELRDARGEYGTDFARQLGVKFLF